MEDLLSIVVLILYFVIARAAGKNKKKKKASKNPSASRKPQFDQAFEQLIRSVTEQPEQDALNSSAAGDETQMSFISAQEGKDPCHASMLGDERPSMRAPVVSQAEMRAAGEGDDPCHTDGASTEEAFQHDSPVYDSPILRTGDDRALAQDILRGVVMSEILNRPAASKRRA